jgi:hypothetical protein
MSKRAKLRQRTLIYLRQQSGPPHRPTGIAVESFRSTNPTTDEAFSNIASSQLARAHTDPDRDEICGRASILLLNAQDLSMNVWPSNQWYWMNILLILLFSAVQELQNYPGFAGAVLSARWPLQDGNLHSVQPKDNIALGYGVRRDLRWH